MFSLQATVVYHAPASVAGPHESNLRNRCCKPPPKADLRLQGGRHAPQTACPRCFFSASSGSVNFHGTAGRAGAVGFATGVPGSSPPPKDQLGKLGRLQQQLKALGLAGVLAYGIFNSIYYTCAFLFIWICVAKVPSGLGAAAAARRFAEVFALTWVGSQVSKIPRAAGALLLAPAADRGLLVLEKKLALRSRQQAFLLVVGCCLAFAATLFVGVVLVWA